MAPVIIRTETWTGTWKTEYKLKVITITWILLHSENNIENWKILNSECLPKYCNHQSNWENKHPKRCNRAFFGIFFTHMEGFLWSKSQFESCQLFPTFWAKICAHAESGYLLFTTLHSNSPNPTVTVTTLLHGGLYSIRCPDVLSSVAGCVTMHLSKAGQLVQQWKLEPSWICYKSLQGHFKVVHPFEPCWVSG